MDTRAPYRPLALVLGAALSLLVPMGAGAHPLASEAEARELALRMVSCEQPDHGTTLARWLVLRLLALSDADLSRSLLPNLPIAPHYRPALRGACGKSQLLMAKAYLARPRAAYHATHPSAPLPSASQSS